MPVDRMTQAIRRSMVGQAGNFRPKLYDTMVLPPPDKPPADNTLKPKEPMASILPIGTNPGGGGIPAGIRERAAASKVRGIRNLKSREAVGEDNIRRIKVERQEAFRTAYRTRGAQGY